MRAATTTPPRTETRIPGIGTFRLPLTRNDLLLLLVAFMQFGLGLETLLAHLISGGVKPQEAIPVIFGPGAGAVLLAAIFMRVVLKRRTLPSLIIIAVAGLSVVVGVIGSAFHWSRLVPPSGIAAGALQWDWLIYAPPLAGPLAFAGVGLLAIIAALEDTRPETGKLTLPGIITFNTPLPQTRQFFWLVAFGLYAATLSSFLDHSRTGLTSFFVWIPIGLGLFASITTTLMALYSNHTTADYFTFFWVMVLMIVMGILGAGLHINADLPEGGGELVFERFIRGAPIMAPMLFALMGAFGIITMVGAETDERRAGQPPAVETSEVGG